MPHVHPTLALVQGDTHPPLIEKTIGVLFEEQVVKHGDTTALVVVQQNVKWSWNQLKERVDRFAVGLHNMGFKKGDRIGCWMPTNHEWVVLQFATAKLGVVLVTLNPAYRVREVEHALKLVECKAIVLTPQFKTSNYANMVKELCPELCKCSPSEKFPSFQCAAIPSLKYIIQNTDESIVGMCRFDDIYVSKASKVDSILVPILKALHPKDPINLQFTSGTTGSPKAATLSHRNILNNGYFVGVRMNFSSLDVVCIPVPLYHCFGLVMGNLGCLTHGATMVYPSFGFDAEATLHAIQNEKCTVLYGVPTMFVAELNHPNLKKYDLTSLRGGLMAGSPCPIEIMKRVMSDLHCEGIAIAYGMTETSPVSFQSYPTTPLQLRVETVGTVMPHLICKVIDSNGGTVPYNTPGELLVKGYSVMNGYWNQTDKTKESIDEEGFMHTGDLATVDDQGYCRIVGRIKDMLIRGGENIYPREIEEFLFTHPDVADVTVVGVPHSLYGEATCVWIILKPGKKLDAQAVKTFCKGRIAHYKIPDYVFFVDAFPLTVSGKIQKYIVREESAKMIAASKL